MPRKTPGFTPVTVMVRDEIKQRVVALAKRRRQTLQVVWDDILSAGLTLNEVDLSEKADRK